MAPPRSVRMAAMEALFQGVSIAAGTVHRNLVHAIRANTQSALVVRRVHEDLVDEESDYDHEARILRFQVIGITREEEAREVAEVEIEQLIADTDDIAFEGIDWEEDGSDKQPVFTVLYSLALVYRVDGSDPDDDEEEP